MRNIIIRCLDLIFSLCGLLVLIPLLILLLIIGFIDTGSPLFFQDRIGKNNQTFKIVKFRSMNKSAASVPTHKLDISYITTFGRFLRHSKLDELPQLWNVLLGDMSLVGPRPCLPTQYELINERLKHGVHMAKPGITGLAQIRNINMSTPKLLAKVDSLMVKKFSITMYFKMIYHTLIRSLK